MKKIEKLVNEMVENRYLIVDGGKMYFNNEWYENDGGWTTRHDNILFEKSRLVKWFFGVLEDTGFDVEEATIRLKIRKKEYIITYLSMLDDDEVEILIDDNVVTAVKFW